MNPAQLKITLKEGLPLAKEAITNTSDRKTSSCSEGWAYPFFFVVFWTLSWKTTSFLVLSFCCLHSYQPFVSFKSPSSYQWNLVYKNGKKKKQFDQNKRSFLWSATIFPSWNAASQIAWRIPPTSLIRPLFTALLSNQDCSQISGQHLCIQHQAL